MENNRFLDNFTKFAIKIGGQIHLCSLRDAFAITMPLFILAGLSVMFNYVILEQFMQGEALATAQQFGSFIINGTLNISALLIAPMIAYSLALNRNFKNPISAVLVSISALIIMMPLIISQAPIDSEVSVRLSGLLSFKSLGTTGMFAGIIVGLLSTEIYIFFGRIKKLQINLGDNIPKAVGDSFSAMIPIMITLSLFGILSFILLVFMNTDLIALISRLIQEPLRKINTSLPGVLTIYSFGNFLFTLGIHQSVINATILDPLLLVNMNENMLAFSAGQPIPHILNSVFVPTFGMLGGTGSTICLLIATFLFGKSKTTQEVAKLAATPGIFNINEPVIFGYPIVFNIPLMIPFVLLPAIGIVFAYIMTTIGFMNHVVVMIPWTTPPLLSAYLATGGDLRGVLVQLIILVFGVFFYLPFMKISDRVSATISNTE